MNTALDFLAVQLNFSRKKDEKMTHAEYEYENQEELKTEYNEKTLHYLKLEALIATAANNKEFFLVFAVII